MPGRIKGKSSTSTTRRATWVQDFTRDFAAFRSTDTCDSLRAEAFARMQALLFGHNVKVTIAAVDDGKLEVIADAMTRVPGWLVELVDKVTVVLQNDASKKGQCEGQ